jgi:hypothetical protein
MTVGTPPGTGPQLVDGTWLQGLAGGANQSYIAGINLTVNNQNTGYFLPGLLQLAEVDTAVASGSLTLPAAQAGTEITIFNNGTGQTINIFANPHINQLTGALDTIQATSNATATTLANNAVLILYCCKNGLWLFK